MTLLVQELEKLADCGQKYHLVRHVPCDGLVRLLETSETVGWAFKSMAPEADGYNHLMVLLWKRPV